MYYGNNSTGLIGKQLNLSVLICHYLAVSHFVFLYKILTASVSEMVRDYSGDKLMVQLGREIGYSFFLTRHHCILRFSCWLS